MADDEPKSNSGPDFVNLPHAFQYSASLNCLISLSKGSGLEIYDVHSRKITSSVPLDHESKKYIFLHFFVIFLTASSSDLFFSRSFYLSFPLHIL